MNIATQPLAPFLDQGAGLLTIYRRTGAPFGTAVRIAIEEITP